MFVLFNDTLSRKHYVASAIEERMRMEHCWGGTERRKPKYAVGEGITCNVRIA